MTHPAVYLDHAATTPVRPEVLEAMLPFLGAAGFGNPSSSHQFGRTARAGLEQARREIAEALRAAPNQVVFTSGGTEADNLAIIGTALAARAAGRPMIVAVSATEHKAVLAAAHHVVSQGGEERIIAVDESGTLNLEALDLALEDRPALVSVMWVNNETGVVQPIAEIAARCQAAGSRFHTDMVQAAGKVPASFADTSIGLATLSGHKLGAPKGIGALLVRDRSQLAPILHGGSQQRALRPGTENVAGAVGLGRAALLASRELATESRRLQGLRDRLAGGLRAVVPELMITAESSMRAPHILNVLVPGTRNDALLMHLDLAGVAASGGSACSSGAVEPSHVLSAMRLPTDLGITAVRFSFGHETSEADVDRVIAVFPGVVQKVRRLAGALGHG